MVTAEKFLPYSRQSIDESDIAEVGKVFRDDIITRGAHVIEFERQVAEYCDVEYAVAFNSGTAALQGACFAAEVSPYDRVITSCNTFVASVGAGIHFGARPVFVDIDSNTGNLDLEQLAEVMSQPHTRGRSIVVPVHFTGMPVDMRALERLIKDPETTVIEDAAHALGSCYNDGGRRVGCCDWSDMTVFSFHPAKTITTGEGGMVTTNDAALAQRLRRFRNNGIERDPELLQGDPAPWYYEVHDITGNYNLTDFQAALGLCQFRRMEKFVEKRRQIMNWYRDKLANIPHISMLASEVKALVAYHLCVVLVDFEACNTTRTQMMERLRESGVGTQVHYIPLYRHPYFLDRFGDVSENFPNMENYYSQALSLPLYYELEEEDVDRVCSLLREMIV